MTGIADVEKRLEEVSAARFSDLENRISSIDNRIGDMKSFVGWVATFFGIIVSVISIVGNITFVNEKTEIRERMKSAEARISDALGKTVGEPEIELIAENKKPLIDQEEPARIENVLIEGRPGHQLTIFLWLRNKGTGNANAVFVSFYVKGINLWDDLKSDDPEFDSQFNPSVLDKTNGKLPPGMSIPTKTYAWIKNGENVANGNYKALAKIFYGDKIVKIPFTISVKQ